MASFERKDEKTLEFYLAAVQQSGAALENVPEKFRTAELCLAAVKQDSNAINYVPDDIKLAERSNYLGFMTSIEDFAEHFEAEKQALSNPSPVNIYNRGISYLNNIGDYCLAYSDLLSVLDLEPDYKPAQKFMELTKKILHKQKIKLHETYNDAIAAVTESGDTSALRFVLRSHRTFELCLKSVQRNGDTLKFVPDEVITLEICQAAVKQDAAALEYVPVRFLNEVDKK